MRCGKAILGLVFLGLPSAASAQTTEALLEQGNVILGMGSVNLIDAKLTLGITNGKMWTCLVDTTASDLNKDGALLRSGFVTLREGMLLASPAGTTLDEFDSVDINSRGDLGTALRIRTPGISGLAEAVAWNLKVLAFESQTVNFTSAQVPAGTKFDEFDWVKLNDRNTLLTGGKLKFTTAPAGRDALVKFELDDLGNIESTNVIAVRFQIIPGINNGPLTTIGTLETNFAMNNSGDVICYVATSEGNGVVRNLNEALAREGEISPLPTRTWATLSASRVALNDAGDYALTGILSGSANTYLIVKNGEKFAQQGDIIPAFSPLAIGGASSAPIVLANNGDLFWRTVVGGDPSVEAIMRNYEPILERGVTAVDGEIVTKLETFESSFAVSPNGRFFVCAVDLGFDDAIVFQDFGLVLELPGCHANPGKLSLASGAARVGENIAFAMDDGHVVGALARINFASRQSIPGSDCGIVTPYGELMISGQHRIGSLFPLPWDGTNPTVAGAAIPPSLSLVDGVFFAQGVFRRPGTANVTFTNALRIEIGAP